MKTTRYRALKVRGLMLQTSAILLAGSWPALAQVPAQISPAALAQLQIQQAPVDTSGPVTAASSFDPPAVRPGQKVFYRVTVEAPQDAITWPEKIPTPEKLTLGRPAIGQISRQEGSRYRPQTTYLFETTLNATGKFTVPAFPVAGGGEMVEVPAATLEVTAEASAVPRQLLLDFSETNIFLGQPVRMRVMLPAGRGNEIDAVREVQLDGDGLMTDKSSLRQAVENVAVDGQFRPAFIHEVRVTPIVHGQIGVRAQAFAAGRDFAGPVVITGQVTITAGAASYRLVVSDEKKLTVRPLPANGERRGFTGSIGKFFMDAAQLSTNRIKLGEPLRLKTGFHGEGNLTRFVPPEIPRSRDWQIIADPAPGSYTLIPLTDDTTNTPAIPFSAFDPETKKYYDLTIPALPVTIVGQALPEEIPAGPDFENRPAPAKLAGPAKSPGRNVASLKPLVMQGWFVTLQILPLLGLLLLWRWDERRRFLEAHPEIVRRRAAKRAIRREQKLLQKAAAAGDAENFLTHAMRAIQAAGAPHYPAEARAMVGRDVLAILNESERAGSDGEMVREIFAATDARFAAAPVSRAGLLARRADIEALLAKLEERL